MLIFHLLYELLSLNNKRIEEQIRSLEADIEQERRLADNLVADMVIMIFSIYYDIFICIMRCNIKLITLNLIIFVRTTRKSQNIPN